MCYQSIQSFRKKVIATYSYVQVFRLTVLFTFLAIITSIILSDPVSAQDQNRQKQRSQIIRGTAIVFGVVTIKGKPIGGVTVDLTSVVKPDAIKSIADMRSNLLSRHPIITTDENGRFQISDVAGGHYCIRAYAPGYVSPGTNSCKSLNINDGEKVEPISLELLRGGIITGRVTDNQGNPVTGETVIAEVAHVANMDKDSQEFSRYNIGHQEQTDDRGVYRIYDLSPGHYRISSGSPPKYFLTSNPTESSENTIEVKEGSEITGIDLALTNFTGNKSFSNQTVNGEVTAKFVTEDGKVLPDIRASMFPVDEDSDSNKNKLVLRRGGLNLTDEDGNLKFKDSGEKNAPSLYKVVRISYGNGYAPKYPFSPRVGNNISVMMTKGGVVTGKVTNPKGEPVVGVILKLKMIRDVDGKPLKGDFDDYGRTDDRGVYRCWGVTPGTYIVYTDSTLDGIFAENIKPGARIYYSSSRTQENATEITIERGSEISGIDIRARKD